MSTFVTRLCETPEDRVREDQAAQEVERAWSVAAPRFPAGAVIDRVLVKQNQAVGYAEIRCKKIRSTSVPDVWLSVRKASEMAGLKNRQKVPVFFIAKFSDGRMGAIESGNVWRHPTVRIKKRHPREGVAHEEEDAFAIPLDSLLWVGENHPPVLEAPEDQRATSPSPQTSQSACPARRTRVPAGNEQLRLL